MNLGPHLILNTCPFSSKPLIHFICQYHTQPVIRNSWIMPNIPHIPLYTYHSSYNHTQPKQIIQEQTDIQLQHCLAQHLAQAEGSRSSEPPPPPRRGRKNKSMSNAGSRLSEIPLAWASCLLAQKSQRVAWATIRGEKGLGEPLLISPRQD